MEKDKGKEKTEQRQAPRGLLEGSYERAPRWLREGAKRAPRGLLKEASRLAGQETKVLGEGRDEGYGGASYPQLRRADGKKRQWVNRVGEERIKTSKHTWWKKRLCVFVPRSWAVVRVGAGLRADNMTTQLAPDSRTTDADDSSRRADRPTTSPTTYGQPGHGENRQLVRPCRPDLHSA